MSPAGKSTSISLMRFHFANPPARLHLQQTLEEKRYLIKIGHCQSPTLRHETPFPLGFQAPPLQKAKLNEHITGRLALPGPAFSPRKGTAALWMVWISAGLSLPTEPSTCPLSYQAKVQRRELGGPFQNWGRRLPQIPTATEKQFHFRAPQTNCELSDFATWVPWFSMAEVRSCEEGKVPGSHLSSDSSLTLSQGVPSRPTGEDSRTTQPPHSG